MRHDLRAVRRGHVDLVELEPPTADEMAGRIAKTTPARRGSWSRSTARPRVRLRHAASRPGGVRLDGRVDRVRRPGLRRARDRAAAMTALLDVLRLQGFHLVVAGITQPNPASTALHRALGSRESASSGPSAGRTGGHGVEWLASSSDRETGRRRRSARWRTRSPTGSAPGPRSRSRRADPRPAPAGTSATPAAAVRARTPMPISQASRTRSRGPHARPYSSRVAGGSRPIDGTSSQS